MIDFKNETVRKRLITIVQLIILVAIVVWLARSFKREDWETLKNQDKNWWLLLGSVMIVLAGHMISYLRWMILVRALDVPLSIAEAIRLGFIGHMFSLVAAGSVGGDLFKAIAVAKRRETRRPEVIASVIMDRAVGLLGLVLLTCVCLGFQTTGGLSEPLLIIRRGAWVCLLIGVCVLTLVVVAGKRVPLNSLVHLPIVGRLIHRMWHSGLIFSGRPSLVVILVGMSLIVQAMLTYGVYLISQSLYADPPSLKTHFQVIPPSFVAGAIPLAPGGMGQMELAVQELFKKASDTPPHYSGFIVALMYRIATFLVAGVGAIYFFLGFGSQSPTASRSVSSTQEPAP